MEPCPGCPHGRVQAITDEVIHPYKKRRTRIPFVVNGFTNVNCPWPKSTNLVESGHRCSSESPIVHHVVSLIYQKIKKLKEFLSIA
jgi:hypothetical protein